MPLTQKSLALAARELAARDETLAAILATHGDPPLWRRATGFTTLVHIILEQQVSLKSAKSMLTRLQTRIEPFTPLRFIELGDGYLRSLGVTRQKSSYLLHLSSSIVNGELSFTKLARMSDDDARLVLTGIKGIGSWSADVYLLMAMRRADIWPSGDLALAVAMKELKGLATRPGPDELEKLAEHWRPHRAVAARMLWQYYLGSHKRHKKKPTKRTENPFDIYTSFFWWVSSCAFCGFAFVPFRKFTSRSWRLWWSVGLLRKWLSPARSPWSS